MKCTAKKGGIACLTDNKLYQNGLLDRNANRSFRYKGNEQNIGIPCLFLEL